MSEGSRSQRDLVEIRARRRWRCRHGCRCGSRRGRGRRRRRRRGRWCNCRTVVQADIQAEIYLRVGRTRGRTSPTSAAGKLRFLARGRLTWRYHGWGRHRCWRRCRGRTGAGAGAAPRPPAAAAPACVEIRGAAGRRRWCWRWCGPGRGHGHGRRHGRVCPRCCPHRHERILGRLQPRAQRRCLDLAMLHEHRNGQSSSAPLAHRRAARGPASWRTQPPLPSPAAARVPARARRSRLARGALQLFHVALRRLQRQPVRFAAARPSAAPASAAKASTRRASALPRSTAVACAPSSASSGAAR